MRVRCIISYMELEDSRREEKPWKPEKINMKHMSNRLRRPQYMEKCVDGGHFRRADLPGGADQHKLSGSDRHGGENGGALDDAGTDSAQRYPDRGKCIPEAGARFWGWRAGSDHRIRQFSCIPALEYKAEGQVFGVGCKIFTIAGPVILYGILSSWGLGVVYWGWMMLTQ